MIPGDDDFKEIDKEDLSAEVEASTSDIEADVESDFVENTATEDIDNEAETDEEQDSAVTVQPVQFASFEDLDQVQGPQNQNLNILLDVKLQLTVELGRTELPIKKVLELTKGSIVTLNKAAGEPVELYANGKLIAYGEVVVIEDNFGLRITHITDPKKRLSSLGSNQQQELAKN
ncbi:MAG: flagellar motor switch protein FliN [Cyanobacteria bacterium SIG28]|nr:flagellar motor switch protein FliN [Cyanobacteria bacterium SIG28]